MDIKIEDIENIIIQQGNIKFKLIHENGDWIFLDLKHNVKNKGYTKKSAYNIVKASCSTVISIPNKTKIYEVW